MLNSEGPIPTGSNHSQAPSGNETPDITAPVNDTDEECMGGPLAGDGGYQTCDEDEDEDMRDFSAPGNSHTGDNDRTGGSYSGDSNSKDGNGKDSDVDMENINLFDEEPGGNEANCDEDSNDEANDDGDSDDEASDDEDDDGDGEAGDDEDGDGEASDDEVCDVEDTDTRTNEAEDTEMDGTDVVFDSRASPPEANGRKKQILSLVRDMCST